MNPLIDALDALAAALLGAGLPVRFASSPEGGPGVVLDIPDVDWPIPPTTGCGDFRTGDLSVLIWVVAYGHTDDARRDMEALAWAAAQAVPAPWRVAAINHDRSTPDQYIREIRAEG